jgi:anti-anti-sigma regulatory factor
LCEAPSGPFRQKIPDPFFHPFADGRKEQTMLRITTHDKPESLTFQLEGKLAGPWVKLLEDCWRNARATRDDVPLRVDLSAVTFIDAAGKELLTSMHAQGSEFLCAGCLMSAAVAEITS